MSRLDAVRTFVGEQHETAGAGQGARCSSVSMRMRGTTGCARGGTLP